MCLQLIDWGFDPNAIDDAGEGPLHWAARWNRCSVAVALVTCGSRLEHADKDGRTPMHVAAEYGRLAVMRELLRRGANPEPLDHCGRTPLSIATLFGRDPASQMLSDHLNLRASSASHHRGTVQSRSLSVDAATSSVPVPAHC